MADMISIKGKPGKVKDKKYVNKIERERNLPGYCLQTLLEWTDHGENR